MWGTYDEATGTFVPNTQATQNPLASLYQKKDVSQSKRFIGNAQVDYKIHGLEDLRLNVNAGIDMSYSGGTVDIPQGAEQSWHAQLQSGSGAYTIYHQKKNRQDSRSLCRLFEDYQ